MTVLSPVTMLYGASTDAFTTATDAREGLSGGAFTEVVTGTVTFPFHLIKHGVYSMVHAADIFLFPIYGLADLHPYGPEIEPLGFYSGTWFDKDPGEGEEAASSTDAESGETAK